VVEFGETQLGGEVAQGEGDEQAAVFAPGRLAYGVLAAAVVGADPGESVIVQQRAGALGALFCLAGDLQRTSLGEARRRLFALAPNTAIDRDKRPPRG
jgi:hypothetical protein